MLTTSNLLDLYSFMIASRESDIVEGELVNSGEANFLAVSKGHEGGVILQPFLTPDDYIHCHYRDKALMLAQGVSNEMFFYSALAKAESHSHGRQMVSHMSDAKLKIMSIVGPVGNNALQSAGVAHVIKNQSSNPIVICAVGDGTTQQGEVLEAIAEAKRSNLPVLFVIHNNGLAISTRTKGKTFFSLPGEDTSNQFYGIPITSIDGTNPLTEINKVGSIIQQMREDRAPQIIILNVERLDNHSNADDQKLYRSIEELSQLSQHDPLTRTREYLLSLNIEASALDKLEAKIKAQVRQSVDIARSGTNPLSTFSAELPVSPELQLASNEYRGDFNASSRYTMLEAMRKVFEEQLGQDPRVCLLGEDIEDGKGDVFGITRGLSTKFPGRVVNSPLSESTISGLACGMSLAGKKPVAFIQFADFLPLAYNQIFTEISTMYWRSNGSWQCPVIIFAACGAYRPGLGPFHSQTNEATFAHIPGLDVYMPSNAADAAGMLNLAFKTNRPSLFLYPKKLLNNSSQTDSTSRDVEKQIITHSKARIERIGHDISLVAYGNTLAMSCEVANTLESVGVNTEVIDLRMIKPYDKETILKSVNKTKKLIVSHEDNYTCGIAADILATVAEYSIVPVKVKRITRPDTYTPCNFINQLEVMPTYEKILTAACELLEINLTWEKPPELAVDILQVDVIGASPSDESVLINKIHVKIGDKINTHQVLVDIEASKSAGEILAPTSGIIDKILVKEGARATVGEPLVLLKLEKAKATTTSYKPLKPILTPVYKTAPNNNQTQVISKVYMHTPEFETGGKTIDNEQLLNHFPEITNQDIIERTGIESRTWLNPNQSIIELTTKAAKKALDKANISLQDIDLIICTTCSPDKYLSPSISCLTLHELTKTYGDCNIPAYDLNAACSGYLYGLQSSKDYLTTRPNARILLLTAENLSSKINPKDFETAFLFADAASATILVGEALAQNTFAEVKHISLGTQSEDGSILNVPLDNSGILMQGKKLFAKAVKSMASSIQTCLKDSNTPVNEIDLVIPHQANLRIIEAVESKLKIKPEITFSNIRNHGNTSSCTIPIAINEAVNRNLKANNITLCAFGAGFTTGAALLKRVN